MTFHDSCITLGKVRGNNAGLDAETHNEFSVMR